MTTTCLERLQLAGRGSGRWLEHLKEFLRSTPEHVAQVLCGLHGHEMVQQREPGRLSLRCLRCGAATAGWTIAPHVRHATRRRR